MYSKVEIYGQCDVNYLHIKNISELSREINDVVEKGLTSPTWEKETILLANYDNVIYASPLTYIDGDVVGYQIQRLDVKRGVMSYVAETTKVVLEDYLVNNNTKYQYYIFPIIKNSEGVRTLGEPIVTGEITPSWEMCTIVGLIEVGKNEYMVDKNNIWRLQLNVERESYELNIDKTFTDGFDRFPKRTQGVKKYITSGINSIIGTLECAGDKINIDASDMERWEEFCYSSNLKLFNDMHGRIIPIDIQKASTGYLGEFENSPLVTTINFVQLADANDITVYGLGGE